MPNFYPDRAAIRAPGHSLRAYASIYVGAVVVSGTITADAANDTARFAVSALVGSMADVVRGMEVVITTSGGLFKLRTHVRYGDPGDITAGNLPIRELSYGTAQIVTGDKFMVLNEHRLHDKLVAATATFDPDLLAYTDEGLHPSPVTCSGGPYAAFVDGFLTQLVPETYATVQMTGSTSYPVDPASGGSGTHLWTLPTGVAFQAGSSSSDPDPLLEADVNPQGWLIQHDFTDDDNGKTTTQYVQICVHDAHNLPYDIMIDSGLQADQQYGWHYTVRLFQDATLVDIPDGSLVILWTNERINGAWQSFRNAAPGRETILAVGYMHRDTNSATAAIRISTFDVVSPAQRLDEITGYSKVMEESATPDAWSKLFALDTKRATVQLIYYYTTLTEAGFDWLFDSGYLNKVYPALYLQRTTPIQQVRELAHGVDALVSCDRSGRFNVYTHPAYIPLAERDAVTVTFILAEQDIIDVEFSRDHYDQVELFKTSGFTAGGSPQPIFSLYPGAAPGEAVDTPTNDRLICDDQDDLNDRTGRYGALADNVFINAAGLKQRGFELKLTLFGSYDFFDFYHEYVAFTLGSGTTLRGVDISSFRFWLKSVQISYQGGTARTALVLQAETNAPAGTTYLPPPPLFPPPQVPPQPPLTPPTTPLGTQTTTLAAFNSDGYVYLVNSIRAAAPVWSRYSLAALGMAGTLRIFIVDAYSPKYRGTGTAVNGLLVTSTEARTISDIFGTPTLGTAHALSHIINAAQGTRAESGLYAVTSYDNGTPSSALDVHVLRAGSWTVYTPSEFGLHTPSSGYGGNSGVFVGEHNPALLLVGAPVAGMSANSRVFQSLSYGAAWANQGDSAFTSNAWDITIPYPISNDSIVYYGGATGGQNTLHKMVNGVQADVGATNIFGHTYGPSAPFGIKASDQNANRLLLVGFGGLGGMAGTGGVWRSDDAAASWVNIVPVADYTTIMFYRGGNIAGNDPNLLFLWGENVIALSMDAGGTIVSKLGDIPTKFGTVGTFVNIAGK